MSTPDRAPSARRPGSLTAVALCWVLLCLGGCGGGTPGTSGTTAKAHDPAATLRLPVEDYLLTARQVRLLKDARTALALSCVARLGLEPPTMPARTSSYRPGDRSLLANAERRYGITDATVATVYGYRPRPGTYPDATSAQEPRMTKAVKLALLGGRGRRPARVRQGTTSTPPTGGCLGEAERSLAGPSGSFRDSPLAVDLNEDSHTWSRRHPRVRAAVRAWAACMREAGHPQTDPLDAPGPDPRFAAPRITPEEIAIALADIGCKRRTHLVETWSGLERQYQLQRIQAQEQRFAQLRRDLGAQVARAQEVMASRGDE